MRLEFSAEVNLDLGVVALLERLRALRRTRHQEAPQPIRRKPKTFSEWFDSQPPPVYDGILPEHKEATK